jgi:23S rRNA (cytosine1962-C5)-methyltransferase
LTTGGELQRLILQNGVQKKIAEGHPWVYRNQIEPASLDAAIAAGGGLAEVYDFRGRYLGSGIFNPLSLLTVRLLTRDRTPIDNALIERRVRAAIAYRRYCRRPDTDSYRLIFGESDLLPGVIADQFADTIVLQILAKGMEPWLAVIADTLIAELAPQNLILQHEEAVRLKEGLPLYRKVYRGQDPEQLTIRENGLQLRVDLAGGQKTGYFLDQKANHAALRRYAAGRRVLDCFCYVGGFALNAAVAGAASVTAVDISEPALALGRANAALNGLERIDWICANVFDFLREAVQQRRSYEVIVLDPPAFAKSHSAIAAARRGYKEINLSALRLLAPGGVLATHSCSFHMSEELFVATVLEAARDAGRTVRIMALRRQDEDHPVLAGYPESHYLKSLWLQALD